MSCSAYIAKTTFPLTHFVLKVPSGKAGNYNLYLDLIYIHTYHSIVIKDDRVRYVGAQKQSVSVRACESAIAHVRAVTSVRKGCEASWNCACEGACVWGYL